MSLAFARAPHLLHPSGDIVVWFTDPPGLVIQVAKPAQGTRSMTDWLGVEVQDALLRRFPEVKGLIVVLDLSLMLGREATARNGLVEPAKRLKQRVARTVLIPPKSASPVYLGSMYAATAVLSAFGVHVELQRSISAVVATHGLQAMTH